MPVLVERIRELCQQDPAVRSLTKLEQILGFGNGAIGKWAKTSKAPSHNRLKSVADYFGVSVEYLLGETDEKTKAAPTDGDGFDIDDFVDGITDRDVLLDLIQRATQKLREVDSATE